MIFTTNKIDVIGDVHGCYNELKSLLCKLGYDPQNNWQHPHGRQVAFLGDLTDRGPANIETLELIWELEQNKVGGLAALGNHDWRLLEYYRQKPVKWSQNMQDTVDEIDQLEMTEKKELLEKIEDLFALAPLYTVCEDKLYIVHGALEPQMIDEPFDADHTDEISKFCLSGEWEGQYDQRGRVIRTFKWMQKWPDDKRVVFGHNVCGSLPKIYTPVVVGLDTGCVFGGTLSAYRFPEDEFVSVWSEKVHSDDSPVLVQGIEGQVPEKIQVFGTANKNVLDV